MSPRQHHITAPVSSLNIKQLPNRSSAQNTTLWIKDKQLIDGAEGLWRIHDNIYDFSEFLHQHPGGAEWLEITKGTDISEAFEVHHITSLPEAMLQKYFVKKAKSKRSSPFTFKDDGFYRTLKKAVRENLQQLPKQPVNTTAFFTDALLAGLFLFSTLATIYWSYKLALLAGLFLGLLTIASHNYFHQKDNVRMLYFNFSLMQTMDWRISHALSHHMHTNTVDDLEITQNEPHLKYLPEEKAFWTKYGPWIYFPFVWMLSFHGNFLKRIYYVAKGDHSLVRWYDFVPYLLPLVMWLGSDQNLFWAFWMWTVIVCVGSFHFAAVGFNAAHHHPDIFHDGDSVRPDFNDDIDWGISQLDSVMDRHEITGSHFLVLTNFGDHALHHLFPTLDHGQLDYLYPTFEKICQDFDVKLRFASQLELIKGSFLQLARSKPNPNPPNLFKTYT